ncbi:proteasome accessory factor PafA2 [Schaalia sp. 19OD2882]|uniref:depupylase/deamidase Dop n=1 Tax=Schaalia sp. 19OD2882 TaxID=2794089 RepID=UPI001C1EB769|nr:depupylase/deamidase Dop [Schaalia sp. 19OD2882]QWW18723.1 proteasome accessory factor PafA2 [Schaalia sp. 19OD2882]
MSVDRIIGTETEYGVYQSGNTWANPVVLSTRVVEAYARRSRRGSACEGAEAVRWDYTAEDPLNDLRGTRMSRAAADPSLLTDDPYHLAPSGGSERIKRPSAEEMLLPAATTAVLTNGARLYVDHAHPEYSAPETRGPSDAVLWDRAGEVIARRIMEDLTEAEGGDIVLVKNNTDGKGAAYGTHENYQVRRDVDLEDLVRCLTPFFVTRPVLCGAGRVGLGQKSQTPGFQISQRADFVENEIGLETTFNRPIINTRDEPHADPARFRRLHVIGGDANLFDVSAFLRFGTTALVLWAIEAGVGLEWDALALDDPVEETRQVSHDPSLRHTLSTVGGRSLSALEVQQVILDLVLATFDRLRMDPDPASREVLDLWQSVLDRMRADLFSVAHEVEWVGKYQLLQRQMQRLGTDWSDPRLAAMDIQWADLRPEKSLVAALDRAGRVHRLFTAEEVEAAADTAPTNTRAHLRGLAVANVPNLVKASWTSLVLDPGDGPLIRVPVPDASEGSADLVRRTREGRPLVD